MYTLPKDVRIGVLRGGPSPEYDVSLKSGAQVLNVLSETHQPVDILIDKAGVWHVRGTPRSPDRVLNHLDVVFNALHGTYGEDGIVQNILNHHAVPYTGSDRFSSAIAMNKWLTKEQARSAGIKTPISVVVRSTDSVIEKAREIFHSIPHPLVVKPTMGGSSLGIFVVKSFPELVSALESVLTVYDSALVEEYIAGKEATCTVVNDFRDRQVYSFPPIEIRYPKPEMVWTYDHKYSGESQIMYPTTLLSGETKAVEDMSRAIHSLLKLSHYSRSDFIVSPRRGVYFLEVNTLPGMTAHSLVPKSLESVGVTLKEFIHHIIGLALNKK